MGDVTTPLSADVVAKDGSPLHLRAIRATDTGAIAELHRTQSDASRLFRFFAPRGDLSEEELQRFTDVDFDRRVALVATEAGTDSPLLGMAGYDDLDDVTAEVAFYIADNQQGRGIGSLMLDHLAAAARERGFSKFVADVLPTNARMLAVFQHAGYKIGSRFDDGVITVELDLAPTEESWKVLRAREHHADALSMANLMRPKRVVQIEGDSLEEDEDLEGALVVVDGDPRNVPELLAQVGEKGAHAALVRSGMALYDRSWHERVLAAVRGGGMRLVGPGSFGMVTATEENLTFEDRLEGGGQIGVFAQGTISSAELAARFAEAHVKVSSFVAAGHRLDVSGNDVMQWWLREDDMKAAALCLDSIGNPRKFARIARVLARRMPVVCYIGSATGQVAPAGHPVATSDLPRGVLSGMLRQSGVIEVCSRGDLVSVARLTAIAGRTPRICIDATTLGGKQRALAALARAGIEHVAAEEAGPESVTVVVDLPVPGQERERSLRQIIDEIPGAGLLVVAYPAPTTVEEAGEKDIVISDNLTSAVGLIRALTRAVPTESDVVAFPDIDRRAVSDALEVADGELTESAAIRLLEAYGIATANIRRGFADGNDSPQRASGSDKASDAVGNRTEPRSEGELIIECVEDPLYGPVIGVAFGEQAIELDDVAYRITPLTWADVDEILREPRLASRHAWGEEFEGLRQLVGRAARLKDDLPRVERLRLDVSLEGGAHVVSVNAVTRTPARMDERPRALPQAFFGE